MDLTLVLNIHFCSWGACNCLAVVPCSSVRLCFSTCRTMMRWRSLWAHARQTSRRLIGGSQCWCVRATPCIPCSHFKIPMHFGPHLCLLSAPAGPCLCPAPTADPCLCLPALCSGILTSIPTIRRRRWPSSRCNVFPGAALACHLLLKLLPFNSIQNIELCLASHSLKLLEHCYPAPLFNH